VADGGCMTRLMMWKPMCKGYVAGCVAGCDTLQIMVGQIDDWADGVVMMCMGDVAGWRGNVGHVAGCEWVTW
jgi:hypothetical protein